MTIPSCTASSANIKVAKAALELTTIRPAYRRTMPAKAVASAEGCR
jgi:hypothetical protein